MALKRLDEEFELKAGTQLLPYMKRLLPSLEGRFQAIESKEKTVAGTIEEVRAIALARINEILIPATEDIVEVTTLGFLLGPSSTTQTLALGNMTFIIDEGPQRASFTPSPYVIVEHTAVVDDYAIARVLDYDQESGELLLNVTAFHGNPGPHSSWVVSSTPGMADSTKLYHDAVAPMHAEVEADRAEVAIARDEVIAAAQALAAAGLDAQAFIRRDGTVPFIALQRAVTPPAGQNDTVLPTTAWSRSRMQEYISTYLPLGGGNMVGALNLWRTPVGAMEAATKAYVDGIIGQGGVMNGNLTINTVNPMAILRPTGAGQTRSIHGQAPNTAARWHMFVGDNAAESGGNLGSDFVLHRYADGGTYLGTGLHISRQTAVATVYNRLDITTGGANINGNIGNAGDFWTYRADNTGVVWMGNQRNARIYYNGGTWDFNAGGISCGGSPLTSGHISCYSIYTQGHGITMWGGTSHGNFDVNGQLMVRGDIVMEGNANYIRMWDHTWGNMYIHHNDDNLGILGHDGGWRMYVNNGGHMWMAAYGWLHDYVNNRAWDIAWYTANTRWNDANASFVREDKWYIAGETNWSYGWGGMYEPHWGAAITGYYVDYGGFYHGWKFRRHEVNINGGWYTTRYEG